MNASTPPAAHASRNQTGSGMAAATAGERNRAGQIAGKVDGVASVDNQIKVVKGS